MTQEHGFKRISGDRIVHPITGGIPNYELHQSRRTGRYYLFNLATSGYERVDQNVARNIHRSISWSRARAHRREVWREVLAAA